jgi:hypothetical protein
LISLQRSQLLALRLKLSIKSSYKVRPTLIVVSCTGRGLLLLSWSATAAWAVLGEYEEEECDAHKTSNYLGLSVTFEAQC